MRRVRSRHAEAYRRDPVGAWRERVCRALPDPSRPRLGGRPACCLSCRPFPRRRSPVKKYIIAVLLGTGAVGANGVGMLTSAHASAQISVFDPANYRQNLLTPARTLSQRDRKSVGEGKSVAVRVDLGGRRNIKKNKRQTN